MSNISKVLATIISEAIEADFWSEDSSLVDAYASENNGEQLDVESLTINNNLSDDGTGNIEMIIGNKTFTFIMK